MKENDYPDFSEKCLSIKIADTEHSFDLCNPTFELQAGKLFLVGIVPKGSSASNWDVGKVNAVLWDQVRSYLIFDSEEEITRAFEVSETFHENDNKNT
jgi:hypothetical protein